MHRFRFRPGDLMAELLFWNGNMEFDVDNFGFCDYLMISNGNSGHRSTIQPRNVSIYLNDVTAEEYRNEAEVLLKDIDQRWDLEQLEKATER